MSNVGGYVSRLSSDSLPSLPLSVMSSTSWPGTSCVRAICVAAVLHHASTEFLFFCRCESSWRHKHLPYFRRGHPGPLRHRANDIMRGHIYSSAKSTQSVLEEMKESRLKGVAKKVAQKARSLARSLSLYLSLSCSSSSYQSPMREGTVSRTLKLSQGLCFE